MDDYNIGSHCSDSTCRQRDYMPIKCKFCHQTYCADHYSILSHNCPNMDRDKKEVFICPFCNRTLPVNQSLTLEENLSIHEALECSHDFKKEKPVKMCQKEKCKTKLSEFNMFECKRCSQKLCLSHRMA